jgi:hypothetical protein
VAQHAAALEHGGDIPGWHHAYVPFERRPHHIAHQQAHQRATEARAIEHSSIVPSHVAKIGPAERTKACQIALAD